MKEKIRLYESSMQRHPVCISHRQIIPRQPVDKFDDGNGTVRSAVKDLLAHVSSLSIGMDNTFLSPEGRREETALGTSSVLPEDTADRRKMQQAETLCRAATRSENHDSSNTTVKDLFDETSLLSVGTDSSTLLPSDVHKSEVSEGKPPLLSEDVVACHSRQPDAERSLQGEDDVDVTPDLGPFDLFEWKDEGRKLWWLIVGWFCWIICLLDESTDWKVVLNSVCSHLH